MAVIFISNSGADQDALRSVLDGLGIALVCVASVQEAVDLAQRDRPVLVICDSQAGADPGWRLFLDRNANVQLIVASRHADEALWAEVLNRGGYDVLTLPFAPDDLRRVLASATRSC